MTTMSRALWNPDDLDRMRMETDRVGDEVVAAFGNETALAAKLLDSLVRTGGPTSETSELIEKYRQQTRHLPPWADRAKIELAQRVTSDNLVPGTILLAMASLPQCYLDHLGAPVLVATRQLTNHVFRRLIQTSHMVFTVYAPGSLFAHPRDPQAIPPGIDKAQTVRLMHALMRHLLLSSKPADAGEPRALSDLLWAQTWDTEALGKPINQEDEAFVILTFSYVTIEGLARLGNELSTEERDSIIHLWSVIGYVMGVHEGLLAHSYADAAVLYALFRARLRGPSEAGQKLTKALLDWIDDLMPPFLRWLDVGGELVLFFNGEDDARMLGVEASGKLGVIHSIVQSLLPSAEKVTESMGQPHPFSSLSSYLAHKMVKAMWDITANDSRRVDWPDHVRVAAGH